MKDEKGDEIYKVHIFHRYLRAERIVTLLYALTLFFSAYFIVIIFPSIRKIQALKDYLEMLPPFLRGFFGEEALLFTTLEGFATIEFFNTTWLVIVGV
ncbi:MAG: hypothetical protein AB1546_07230, partial [bacterium]